MADNSKKSNNSPKELVGFIFVILLAVLLGYFYGKNKAGNSSADQTSEEQAVSAWICPMCPQIREAEFTTCPICGMDLVPLSDEDVGLDPSQLSLSENAMKLIGVETMPVKREFVSNSIRMVGKIDYDETRLAYLTAWVPGRLDRLFVDFTGASVQQGDHMAEIYSQELYTAQQELIQAIRTAKDIQTSNTDFMRTTWQETIDAVREKLRLWGVTDEQIRAIEQSSEINDRMTIFAPIGGVVIEKHVSEGMYVKTGSQIYTIADLSKVWVMLDAYESDLQWLRYGQQVEFTTISYPGETFKGTISFIDPVLNEKTRTVKVRVAVDNQDAKLKPQMFVRAVVHSSIAAGGRVMDPSLSGKWVSPMHPEIIKDGPGTCDICGMPLVTAESMGYVSELDQAETRPLVIPASAVLMTGSRAIVYTKVPNKDKPIFEGKEIILGPRSGDYYLVKSGLKEGEEVVVNGNFKIDSEMQIQTKLSMMTLTARDDRRLSQASVSEVFREQLAGLIKIYFSMQQSLAADDLPTTIEHTKKMIAAVRGVDILLLPAEYRKFWTDAKRLLGPNLNKSIEQKDIDDFRIYFEPVSQAFIELTKLFGSPMDESIYLTFCPMVGNEGAFWLQTNKLVRNPYHGDRMLACGTIKSTITPADVWQKVSEEINQNRSNFTEPLTQITSLKVSDPNSNNTSVTPPPVQPPVQPVKPTSQVSPPTMPANPQSQNSMAMKKEMAMDMESMLPPTYDDDIRQELVRLFEVLFDMQGTLYYNNTREAINASKTMQNVIVESKAHLKMKPGKRRDLISNMLVKLKDPLKKSLNTKTIGDYRKYYYTISEQFIEIAKEFGSPMMSQIFLIHCSEGFDGNGVSWLQNSVSKIENPYIGYLKPKCGNIKTVIEVKEIWDISLVFEQKVKKLLDQYLAIQQMLANDRFDESVAGARKLLVELKRLEGHHLTPHSHHYWEAISERLQNNTTKMVSQKTITDFRDIFQFVSKDCIEIAKNLRSKKAETLYVFFSQQALNGKGAYWLQRSSQIRNPYFGRDISNGPGLLNNGEVKETLPVDAMNGGMSSK